MPQINCPHCGQPYAIPPEQWPQYEGRRITCTKCNQPFDVVDPAAPRPSPPAVGAQPAGGYPQPGYYTPAGAAPPKKGMGGGMIALLVCGILLLVFVVCGGGLMAILLPSLNRAREQANRVKCASNLRQIGVALLMYQNQEVRTGSLPNHLDLLMYSPANPGGGADLSGNVFICPDDDRNTPSTASGQQLAADLKSGGHLSYVYFFENKDPKKWSPQTSDTVVMYEPLTEHHGEGSNFLFGDGHVEFFKKNQAAAMIADLENGTNPPSPVSGP